MKANFSIEGRWAGQVRYGYTYPPEYRSRVLEFTMKIRTENEMILGNCEDDHTRKLLLLPASIEGSYKDGSIQFVKLYPCRIMAGEKGELKPIPTEKSQAIYYYGRLYRHLISGKNYFKGDWYIQATTQDENGTPKGYTIAGKWRMKKIS